MPDKEKIKEFLRLVDEAEKFSGSQQLIRGYGAHNPVDCPNKDYSEVYQWLRKLSES